MSFPFSSRTTIISPSNGEVKFDRTFNPLPVWLSSTTSQMTSTSPSLNRSAITLVRVRSTRGLSSGPPAPTAVTPSPTATANTIAFRSMAHLPNAKHTSRAGVGEPLDRIDPVVRGEQLVDIGVELLHV